MVIANAFSVFTILLAVVLTANDGLTAISIAVSTAYVLQLIFSQYWLAGRSGGLSVWTLAEDARTGPDRRARGHRGRCGGSRGAR